MRALLPLLSLSAVAQALYFYIEGSSPKCFFEELPHDTLVVGHYTAEEFDEHRGGWYKHEGISVYISVDVRSSQNPLFFSLSPTPLSLTIKLQEVFDNDHRVVSQRGGASGKFTFTAAEAGDHKICFTPSSNSGRSGWLSLSHPNGGIRLTLDVAIGETSAIESSDKDKLQDLATRVKDLNARLNDIRREQVFQRVSTSFSSYLSPTTSPNISSPIGTGGRIP